MIKRHHDMTSKSKIAVTLHLPFELHAVILRLSQEDERSLNQYTTRLFIEKLRKSKKK